LKDECGLGVVDAGDELGYPLKQARRFGFKRVVLGGMIGKFSKLAQGRLQTHVGEGEVNFEFLAEIAAGQGAGDEVCAYIRAARTAHQVQAYLQGTAIRLEPELARRVAGQAVAALGTELPAQVLIFSLYGDLLGQAEAGPLQGASS
jgi:cobalt-precorrin-5B (C1)-methyltransferase